MTSTHYRCPRFNAGLIAFGLSVLCITRCSPFTHLKMHLQFVELVLAASLVWDFSTQSGSVLSCSAGSMRARKISHLNSLDISRNAVRFGKLRSFPAVPPPPFF